MDGMEKLKSYDGLNFFFFFFFESLDMFYVSFFSFLRNIFHASFNF